MSAELGFSTSDSRSQSPAASVPVSLATASWCARRGWPVHPLAPGRKTPAANCASCRATRHSPTQCPCLAADRWCHGFHAATLDQRRISQWWGSRPDFGVAVACGPASLVVIDIDAHQTQPPSRDRILPGIPIADHVDLTGLANGFHTLAVLAALRGQPCPADDQATLRVRTPSGGLHVWYRASDNRRWQCSSGSSSSRALAWQVDVRAHGGYIVAPGTTTEHGTYTVLGDTREPALLPGWLAQELERTGHLPAPHIPAPRPVPPRAQQAVLAAGGGSDRIQRLLTAVLAPVHACGEVSEGAGFSDTLNRAAYTLGGLVAAGRLPEGEAARLLTHTAIAARPGQERRIEQIISSGLAAGLKHPLHPHGGRP
ncbi:MULTISPECIES: bifunctional DNA primase/polymerase [unclassified Streptomyces]|uniref:bifunctional DNA primase/polymerase n=1 Tax=unclassified Streptomyces TaxID=2593676 RepID=UPI0029B098BC|nr:MULTISPECIES: bifunctional DNA primase/polymerase [unclassified Streptomyces]MDX3772287.1 bifunctional DNA primase/polymerase [Streptomyces sp. AK08-01B]MDX3821800.1 bifunctional DNA primase/polymerase [Streptomyces sp. AK08-01A]